MSYENVLIREATERHTPWCSQCERDADDCVCEELCDHFRSEDVGVFSNSGTADVCVPAVVSEPAQWEKAALKEIDAI